MSDACYLVSEDALARSDRKRLCRKLCRELAKARGRAATIRRLLKDNRHLREQVMKWQDLAAEYQKIAFRRW